jgi:hypothetical protein
MSRLKISELSFCEVVGEKSFEVIGGLGTIEKLDPRISSLWEKYFPTDIDSFTKVESFSPEDSVEKFENKAFGVSGFKFSSKDGNTKATVITGPGFAKAFASSSKSSQPIIESI